MCVTWHCRETFAPAASTSPAPARPLTDKLAEHDHGALLALGWLRAYIDENAGRIIAIARERTITGHERHGDGYLYEFDRDQLERELLEEVADAVNYSLRRLNI